MKRQSDRPQTGGDKWVPQFIHERVNVLVGDTGKQFQVSFLWEASGNDPEKKCPTFIQSDQFITPTENLAVLICSTKNLGRTANSEQTKMDAFSQDSYLKANPMAHLIWN